MPSRAVHLSRKCKRSNKAKSATSNLDVAVTFLRFRQLPPELRDMIWRYTFKPRMIDVWGDLDKCRCIGSHHMASTFPYRRRFYEIRMANLKPPAALHVCQESRIEAQRFYCLKSFRNGPAIVDGLCPGRSKNNSKPFYVNLEIDVFCPMGGAMLMKGFAEAMSAIPFRRFALQWGSNVHREIILRVHETFPFPEVKEIIIFEDSAGKVFRFENGPPDEDWNIIKPKARGDFRLIPFKRKSMWMGQEERGILPQINDWVARKLDATLPLPEKMIRSHLDLQFMRCVKEAC